MIDVNLLKKSGIYSANKNDFSDIDDLEKRLKIGKEILQKQNPLTMTPRITIIKNKKSKKISLKILTLLLMLFIASGYYFYYHHSR